MSESRIGFLTWVAIIVLTCISVFLAEFIPAAGIVATICLVLGGVKAHLIFTNFMELRPNMLPWRIILEAWVIVAVIAILIPFWMSILL